VPGLRVWTEGRDGEKRRRWEEKETGWEER